MGRVGALLRALSSAEPDGATTTQIAQAAGIARPTAHRLLTALLKEDLTDRNTTTGEWHLGPECFLLGAAARNRYDVSDVAVDIVRRLARQSGESAFLSVRRGDETVCLIREDGSFPIRSHVLHEGIRFPLGVASAGMAVLACLPEREQEDYINRSDLVATFGAMHTRAELRGRIIETRNFGYAVNPGLIDPGSWGLGAAVFDARGFPQWAFTLTGIEARIAPPRQEALGKLLLHEAHALTRRMNDRAYRPD